MKEFESIGSYIDESQIGRHRTFLVINDINRNPNDEFPFIDLFPEVIIDGELHKTKEIRPKERSFHRDMIDYTEGSIIGIEVME